MMSSVDELVVLMRRNSTSQLPPTTSQLSGQPAFVEKWRAHSSAAVMSPYTRYIEILVAYVMRAGVRQRHKPNAMHPVVSHLSSCPGTHKTPISIVGC